jgi:hypothetical protein
MVYVSLQVPSDAEEADRKDEALAPTDMNCITGMAFLLTGCKRGSIKIYIERVHPASAGGREAGGRARAVRQAGQAGRAGGRAVGAGRAGGRAGRQAGGRVGPRRAPGIRAAHNACSKLGQTQGTGG